MLPSPVKLRLFRMNEGIHADSTASEPQDRVAELIEQQTAISEVLRAIASSPHDLQPIFDAIIDSATRLCRADIGSLRLSEECGLRLVAVRGDPVLVSRVRSSFPVVAEKGSLTVRLAASSRLPTHIPDFTALEGDHRDVLWTAILNIGYRTSLSVPLLIDNEIVGIIGLARTRVQPFSDKQISLFSDFAAQASIALESTRRERQYREMQSELAHANRVATMGQLTASIAHEVKQPITAARTYAAAALRFLDKSPPDVAEVRAALTCIVNETARTRDVVDQIGSLIKKAPPRKEVVDLNAAILEVTVLTHSEAVKTGVTVGTQLADELPHIHGDRVQLQQVTLNLIVNAIQSMRDVEDGDRELQISTVSIEPEGVCVAVRDTGLGCARRGCRVSLNPSTRPSPTAWGWASRSAARSSKPMVGGCGRPDASRGVPSFSLRSPLAELPSVIDVAYWHLETNVHFNGKFAYTSSFQYSLTSYLRTSSTQVVSRPCRGISRSWKCGMSSR
jgi:GAF domain-containing protein